MMMRVLFFSITKVQQQILQQYCSSSFYLMAWPIALKSNSFSEAVNIAFFFVLFLNEVVEEACFQADLELRRSKRHSQAFYIQVQLLFQSTRVERPPTFSAMYSVLSAILHILTTTILLLQNFQATTLLYYRTRLSYCKNMEGVVSGKKHKISEANTI